MIGQAQTGHYISEGGPEGGVKKFSLPGDKRGENFFSVLGREMRGKKLKNSGHPWPGSTFYPQRGDRLILNLREGILPPSHHPPVSMYGFMSDELACPCGDQISLI